MSKLSRRATVLLFPQGWGGVWRGGLGKGERKVGRSNEEERDAYIEPTATARDKVAAFE